jgi:hypothetical protein
MKLFLLIKFQSTVYSAGAEESQAKTCIFEEYT